MRRIKASGSSGKLGLDAGVFMKKTLTVEAIVTAFAAAGLVACGGSAPAQPAPSPAGATEVPPAGGAPPAETPAAPSESTSTAAPAASPTAPAEGTAPPVSDATPPKPADAAAPKPADASAPKPAGKKKAAGAKAGCGPGTCG